MIEWFILMKRSRTRPRSIDPASTDHQCSKPLQSAWIEPLTAMWRFTKNNGITEGFHRKMKLIQRRAYGFKNFCNYRLRMIAQCG